jgi:Zn finger protein HypA/HybF involved in hydrogenase expression
VIGVIAVVVVLVLLSIGFTIVEFRKRTPLAFRCQRCGTEFRQPAHREFPRACPRCGADDWAT